MALLTQHEAARVFGKSLERFGHGSFARDQELTMFSDSFRRETVPQGLKDGVVRARHVFVDVDFAVHDAHSAPAPN